MTRNKQIREYLKDYLVQKFPDLDIGKKYFKCPFESGHSNPVDYPTANISTNNVLYCSHPSCGKIGDIFDLAKKLDFDGADISKDDLAEYLIQLFEIKTDDSIDKLFDRYMQYGFDLVPVEKGGKASNIEKEWEKKIHKHKSEWIEWLDAGLNIGVKTGKLSNVLILDFDLVPSKLKKKIYAGEGTDEEIEEAKQLKEKHWQEAIAKFKELGVPLDTLTQDTFGGKHLIYEYDSDLPKTVIKFDNYNMDLESEGGQVVIEPSVVGGYPRTFNDAKVQQMPEALKGFLLESVTKIPENKTPIQTDGEFNIGKVKGLEGYCNNAIVQVLGKFRKFMPIKAVEQAGAIINNDLLDDPMDSKSIRLMVRELEKYHKADMKELSSQVLERLDRVEEATIQDLTYSLRQERKDIEDVLRYLVDQDKIYKRGTKYRLFQKADWKESFIEDSKILPFKVPYFNKYATFRNGDMIVIGAMTGVGKSHVALNIIKQLADQGIKPDYISSEPGNRFAKIALALGLKEGDFRWDTNYRPERLELADNMVTIVDWLLPENYAETDKLYQKFAQQLDKHGGLLFIFSQLFKNGEFPAKNMIDWFASLSCKYKQTAIKDKHGNTTFDNENTFFETEKIRESKDNRQHIIIPTKYYRDTKILSLKG